MKFKEFIAAVNKKSLKHVYLLAGAESYFIDKAREKILSLLFDDKSARNEGLTTLDCDNKIELSTIINTIDTAPLFVDKNVVLVKNATLFKARGDEGGKSGDAKIDQLIKILSNMLDTNYVIFTTSDAPDKRKKLYKTIDKIGAVLEAEQLRSYQLEPWLNDKLRSLGLAMDADARQYFIETAALMPEVSLGLLDNELEKVALFVRDKRISRDVLQKVLASLPEISNFALSDAVTSKNLAKSMQILRLQSGELKNLLGLLPLLVRQVRLLLRAKCLMERGVRGKDLGTPLGLHPFIAQKTGEASKRFTAAALELALIELAEADFGLKTGTGGGDLVERAVMKLILSEGR